MHDRIIDIETLDAIPTNTNFECDGCIQIFPKCRSYYYFFEQFLLSNRPCIIQGVTDDWDCMSNWVTCDGEPNLEYLHSHYSNVDVTVADCNKKYFNSQLKTTMKFQDFICYWKNHIEKNHPDNEPCLYLKDWHFTRDFPNENVYKVPFEFCNDWLNEYFAANKEWNDDYRFVYMGPKKSWTPFHVDVFSSYSWSVNVCGHKKWILLAPGEENKLKDKFGNLPYDISFLEDTSSCDLDVKYIIVYQKAGEAIFVPSGWHHQVWNLKDTISINHNWVNACNVKSMWKSMLNNLSSVQKEIGEFRETMCDWVEHCQILLKSCFGMDFNDFHMFLINIAKKRKMSFNTVGLNVHSNWIVGKNHVKYDLITVNEMLKVFHNHREVKLYLNRNNNVNK